MFEDPSRLKMFGGQPQPSKLLRSQHLKFTPSNPLSRLSRKSLQWSLPSNRYQWLDASQVQVLWSYSLHHLRFKDVEWYMLTWATWATWDFGTAANSCPRCTRCTRPHERSLSAASNLDNMPPVAPVAPSKEALAPLSDPCQTLVTLDDQVFG